MGVEKILEKEWDFVFLTTRPKIKLKVFCSCGKKYIIKEDFNSWNQSYTRRTECPKCKDESFIKHKLSYPDEGPKYTAEIVTEKIA